MTAVVVTSLTGGNAKGKPANRPKEQRQDKYRNKCSHANQILYHRNCLSMTMRALQSNRTSSHIEKGGGRGKFNGLFWSHHLRGRLLLLLLLVGYHGVIGIHGRWRLRRSLFISSYDYSIANNWNFVFIVFFGTFTFGFLVLFLGGRPIEYYIFQQEERELHFFVSTLEPHERPELKGLLLFTSHDGN
jgi:hypothetical protein